MRLFERLFGRGQAEDGAAVRLNGVDNALRIDFGEGEGFERIEIRHDGTMRRHVCIRLRNAGDGELTGCRLTVEDIMPPPRPGYVPAVLASGFSLARGELRQIDIVSLSERLPIRMVPQPDDDVVLVDVPMGFGHHGIRTCLEPVPRRAAYTLILGASARETSSVQARCLVFVEGRLRNLKMKRTQAAATALAGRQSKG